jgi:hypothetical protein
MKLKLLLFLMVLAGMLYAQEPYRNLIITEASVMSIIKSRIKSS